MIQLAIIRHGHTQWNRVGKIQGRKDIPLDAEAIAELSGFGLPDNWKHAMLISSPLQRAVHTAELIAQRSPQIEPALIEMDYGDWEGRRGFDLYSEPESGFRHLPEWGWDYQPPNGESPAAVWSRLSPWINSLSEDTVAVCHIGVMRALLAKAFGWPFKGAPPFSIKRNSLYCLQVSGLASEASLTLAEPFRVRLIEQGN